MVVKLTEMEKCERETVWEEEKGGELVVCFGQVEIHLPVKYSNEWLDIEVCTSQEKFGLINMQMAFKATERKRGQRTKIQRPRGKPWTRPR